MEFSIQVARRGHRSACEMCFNSCCSTMLVSGDMTAATMRAEVFRDYTASSYTNNLRESTSTGGAAIFVTATGNTRSRQMSLDCTAVSMKLTLGTGGISPPPKVWMRRRRVKGG